MNFSQQNQKPSSISEAAKVAFPYSAPMIAGFLFLGVAYGIYMKALGFGFLYPTLMALLIYAGSVEFIAAGALIASFAPLSVFLIALMVSGRQIFYAISMLEKYGVHIGKKTLVFNHHPCR
ncbi:branched-chain amino acid permease [Haemophilus aegyptius]|nr:branched-chain amino acid permease [Haemophilus aegyptius]